MNFLEKIDGQIVLFVNGWHHPITDEFMWWISSKLLWIPLYILLIYLIFRKFKLNFAIILCLATIISVGLSDFIASSIIKESIQRYRPSHHLELMKQLHFYALGEGHFYQGGMYGFVSSHAANFFAIATSFAMYGRRYFPKITGFLFLVAILVSFSRLYLGVHYPSDLLGGALVGVLVSWASFKFIWPRIWTGMKIDQGLRDE
ncbi:MAG: phosphatase PAP2 family protein [Bacteroidetes bacterium]|nr:MAG: phosphatase PAP2 family protein [Bacteroidota bacterium]